MLIGLDVDGCVADFVGACLTVYKQLYITCPYSYNDVTGKLQDLFGEDKFFEVMEFMEENQAVKHFEIYKDAKWGVDELRKNHKVVFVTSPYWEYKDWVIERREWLFHNFNCSDKDIVLTHDKNLFAGDILIDDYSKNVKNWQEAGKGFAIKMVQPWNSDYVSCYCAYNFDEIIKKISIIEKINQERNNG